MRTISSASPGEDLVARAANYTGQDASAALRIYEDRLPELDEYSAWLYDFEMRLLAPATACSIRGLKLDEPRALALVNTLRREEWQLEAQADELLARHGWPAFKLGSPDQLKAALYGSPTASACPECGGSGRIVTQVAAAVALPEVYKSGPRKGEPKQRVYQERSHRCRSKHTYPGFGLTLAVHHKTKRTTVGAAALEHLLESADGDAAALAQLRLDYVARQKQRGFLQAPRNPSGYYPFSLTVGGTDTLRFSSSSSAFAEGFNSQNIDKRLDELFVADDGYDLWEIDLSRAESHVLARIAQDPAYIQAHEGPYNSHVWVARLCWPNMAWTDNPDKDEGLVKHARFTEHTTIYDAAKRVQHALGRGGSWKTVARAAKMSEDEARALFAAFSAAFPRTMEYLNEFRESLKHISEIKLDWGGPKWKFKVTGSPYDDETFRKLISAVLQSAVWYVSAQGFLNCWNRLDEHHLRRGMGQFELLNQKHDSVVFQVKRGGDDWRLVAHARHYMRTPLVIHSKPLILGNEVQCRKQGRLA